MIIKKLFRQLVAKDLFLFQRNEVDLSLKNCILTAMSGLTIVITSFNDPLEVCSSKFTFDFINFKEKQKNFTFLDIKHIKIIHRF